MEETDPARILPAKKQVAEATTSSSGGAVPMVPPMGMPMSPHAPRAGDAAGQQQADQPLYTADMPAEGFGSPAVALTHGQLLPGEPVIAATSATAAVPAMSARVAEPLTPLQPALPAEHVPSDDVRILPVEEQPCTCCGDHHDGQETRPFDPEEPERRHLGHDPRDDAHDRHAGDEHDRHDRRDDHDDHDGYDHDHSDHHRGEDAGDHLVGTHDGNADTRPGAVTDPAPTDGKPDDDRCCACCGDEHPGLDNAHGDGTPGAPTDTDDHSDEDSDEDAEDSEDSQGPGDDDSDGDSEGDSDGDSDSDSDGDSDSDSDSDSDGGPRGDDHEDDDCPADDEDGQSGHGGADGQDGEDQSGHGSDDSDGRPGKDEDRDECGNGSDDKPGKGDDKPGKDDPGDRPGGDRPGGDRPGGDRPSNHEGGTPGKPLPPGAQEHGQERPKTPADSNYAVDGGKPTTPAVPGDRATMAPPTQGLTKPLAPTQTGTTTPAKPLGQQTTPATSGGSPTTPAIPASQKLAMPLTPTTAFVPPTTGGQTGGNGEGGPGGFGSTGGSPQTFYKSEPPPGFEGNGNGNGNGNGDPGGVDTSGGSPQTFTTTDPPPSFQGNGNGNGNGNGEGTDGGSPTSTEPRQAAMRMTMPATVTNPGTNGNGNGNPLFSTGGTGPGGTPPPTNGNVGPDPNVKFDEAAFNQLIAVVGGVRDTIGKAARLDITYLDSELLVQPNNQTWEPATKLVTRGGIFGGSVDTENTSLEKTLKTFHESLQLAKEVFKETDDLAAYDATRFTTAYPGFNNGGLPGGAF